ncbi:hypothetical protein Nepgr_029930 [Nepenthes gracilis]|uniref:Autophagy-related protein n=1 Tax=Nepenthes gracilis TaxID=150966 RepID=A0AAD3TEU6_NEPGR|nr:hypothetical protein Nepgr_029930 [Nepenthes gracilis]
MVSRISVKEQTLVLADSTVGQFVEVVRKRIRLGAEKAIFIFVKNVLPSTDGVSPPEILPRGLLPTIHGPCPSAATLHCRGHDPSGPPPVTPMAQGRSSAAILLYLL